MKFEGIWGELAPKRLPDTISDKIPETSSNFDVKWSTTGKCVFILGGKMGTRLSFF